MRSILPPVQALYENDGAGHFKEVAREQGLAVTLYGMGCACADIDGDGDLDVAITGNNGPARLFRNEGGNQNGWIRLKLAGKAPNTDALGAVIEADIGGETHRAVLTSGRSYLSQCEQVITFGLASHPRAEAVRLWWPGSKEPEELGSIPSRTYRVISQP